MAVAVPMAVVQKALCCVIMSQLFLWYSTRDLRLSSCQAASCKSVTCIQPQVISHAHSHSTIYIILQQTKLKSTVLGKLGKLCLAESSPGTAEDLYWAGAKDDSWGWY